jgi:hypothetical protein
MHKFLVQAFQANKRVLIVGPPGTAKTALVEQAIVQINKGQKDEPDNQDFYDLLKTHPVVDDPIDWKGLPIAFTDDDGNQVADFIAYGNLNRMCNAERPLVVFVDDFGQANESVQKALMQPLHGGTINGKKISDKVIWVSATNSRKDKAGVSGLLEPVKSRFHTIVNLEVNTEDWVCWALQNNMPTELVAFIRFRPNLLHDFKATKDLENSPCPRTVTAVGEWFNAGIESHEVIVGAAGEAFAAEFMAFLKVYRDLAGLPDEIILNAKTARIPDDPAQRYALCGALADRATETNFDAICQYADRLKDEATAAEFSVLMIKDTTDRNKKLKKTNAFINWTTKNSDILG